MECKHYKVERVIDKTKYLARGIWNGLISDYCPKCHKQWSIRCSLRSHPDGTVSILHTETK